VLRGTLDRVRFRGASLTDNALGDPAERELIVYLPPSYQSGERRYPLVMVLPGFAANNASLLNFKPWEPNLLERYEALLPQGCGEAILVLPDCFTRLGGSQYIDSPALGDYQRYLADDVLGLVDARYRTLGRRAGRAIVGKSSGGFGALRMGMDRPECFAVVGSHAGDSAFELSIQPRFVEVAPVYERHGGAAGFLRTLFGGTGQPARAPRSQAEFHALEILALAHAYAPLKRASEAETRAARNARGEAPAEAKLADLLPCQLPFDPRTAMLVPEIWARWLAHDPVVRAASEPSALREARLVFLDAGKSDEYGLQFGARLLAERLSRSGVAVDHEEFEGGHMGTAYRYDVSLPKIIAALDPPELVSLNTAQRTAAESNSPRATGARTTREPL
jgi:enterochelin esterase-like enzyme